VHVARPLLSMRARRHRAVRSREDGSGRVLGGYYVLATHVVLCACGQAAAEHRVAQPYPSVRVGIERCYVVEKAPGEAGPALTVQTDGIHFPAAWEATDVVDWPQARARAASVRVSCCWQGCRTGCWTGRPVWTRAVGRRVVA